MSKSYIRITMAQSDYENNMPILEVVWTLLRELEKNNAWMRLQDGEHELHPSWTPKPVAEGDPYSRSDIIRVWEIEVSLEYVLNGNKLSIRMYDAIKIVVDALKPLNVNMSIHSHDGTGSMEEWLGPYAKEQEYEAVEQRFYEALTAMIAWRNHDDSGMYNLHMGDSKRGKRLVKLAKTYGLVD